MKRANLPHDNSGNLTGQVSVAREPRLGNLAVEALHVIHFYCNAGRPLSTGGGRVLSQGSLGREREDAKDSECMTHVSPWKLNGGFGEDQFIFLLGMMGGEKSLPS